MKRLPVMIIRIKKVKKMVRVSPDDRIKELTVLKNGLMDERKRVDDLLKECELLIKGLEENND